MNYEDKYKSALGWIRSIYPTMQGADKEDAEHYFPELRESEDERIRKELIERFKWELKGAEEQDAAGCSRQKDIAMFKQGLAWLEKKGKQNTIVNESPSKEIILAVWELGNIWKELTKGNSCTEYGTQLQYIQKHWNESDYYEKLQGEQKPWNEEDKLAIERLVDTIEIARSFKYGKPKAVYTDEILDSLINWLKSIKPNHWKPSKQNIKDLEWCADLVKDKMGVGFHRLQVFIDELRNL